MRYSVITTPFPYIYAPPHIGNITQLVKTDVLCKLRNSFYENHWVKTPTVFSLGFHLTGLPIYSRLESFQNFRSNRNTDYALVKEFLILENLSELIPFLDSNITKFGLSEWYALLQNYYVNLLDTLNVNYERNYLYTTTNLNSRYDSLVKRMYKELLSKNLIIEKDHYLIGCNLCKNILGDHDRKSYQGYGLNYQKVLNITSNQKTYLVLDNQDLTQIQIRPLENSRISLSVKLIEVLDRKKPSNTRFIGLTRSLLMNNLEFNIGSETSTLNLESQPKISDQLYYAIADINCRCNGYTEICKQKTLFVNFENENWKHKVIEAIQRSHNERTIKDQLISSARNLRDVAFLRSKGYGTKLPFLVNYEDKIVDSLMDSPLFFYIYPFLKEDLDPWELDISEHRRILRDYDFIAEVTGKDLIPTHLTLMWFFREALYPDISLPFFKISSTITDSKGLKMSKSLGNVINYETLKNYPVAYIRGYITSHTDNIESQKFCLDQMVLEGKATLKNYNRVVEIVNSLEDRHLQDKRLITHIQQIYELLYPTDNTNGKLYHIRHLKEKILSHTSKILKEIKTTEPDITCNTEHIVTRKLILDLASCFIN
jgi:leucyl-tRNA synthetase